MSKVFGRRSGAQLSMQSAGTSFKTYGNPIPYVAPVGIALLFLALGVAGRVLRTDVYAWYWSVLVALGSVALIVVTYLASRARGKLTNAVATAGVALATSWLWWLIGQPAVTWRPFVVYLIFALVICLCNAALVALREGQPGGQGMHDQMRGQLAKIKNLNRIHTIDGEAVARFELEPGATVPELQRDVESVASFYGAPPGGVRVLPNPDDARVGELRISAVDHLRTSPAWPGPSCREGTVMDPVVLGIRAGRRPLHFWLTGDKRVGRNASMIVVVGMTGAGKSEGIRLIVLETLSRGGPADVEYWYLNSRKAAQEPAWMLEGAARVATTKKDVVRALRELHDEMPARAAEIGAQGLDEWAPGCGIPLRLVIADEFADVANDVENVFVNLTETLRSLGVVLIVGFQRVTYDRMPTSARSNFGTVICFGVKAEDDATGALPEEVLDAGAAPWKWGNRKPGMCYLVAPGVPEDDWSTDARTFKPDKTLMEKWARHFLALRNRGTVAPVAPSGVARSNVAPDVVARAGKVTLAPMPVPEPDDDALAGFDEGNAVGEVEGMLLELNTDDPDLELDDDLEAPDVPPDIAEELRDADPAEDLPAPPGVMRLGLSPKMSPDAARLVLAQHLESLASQGVETFKAEDLADFVLSETGMTPSWLRKWLGRLSEGPGSMLIKVDERGWYEMRKRVRADA